VRMRAATNTTFQYNATVWRTKRPQSLNVLKTQPRRVVCFAKAMKHIRPLQRRTGSYSWSPNCAQSTCVLLHCNNRITNSAGQPIVEGNSSDFQSAPRVSFRIVLEQPRSIDIILLIESCGNGTQNCHRLIHLRFEPLAFGIHEKRGSL